MGPLRSCLRYFKGTKASRTFGGIDEPYSSLLHTNQEQLSQRFRLHFDYFHEAVVEIARVSSDFLEFVHYRWVKIYKNNTEASQRSFRMSTWYLFFSLLRGNNRAECAATEAYEPASPYTPLGHNETGKRLNFCFRPLSRAKQCGNSTGRLHLYRVLVDFNLN